LEVTKLEVVVRECALRNARISRSKRYRAFTGVRRVFAPRARHRCIAGPGVLDDDVQISVFDKAVDIKSLEWMLGPTPTWRKCNRSMVAAPHRHQTNERGPKI